MKAICYENTKTTIPNWNPSDELEKHCPQGYAYQIDGYFYIFMDLQSHFIQFLPD